MKLFQLFAIVILILSISCVRNKSGVPSTGQNTVNEKVFEVKEVIQTSSYTYMKVSENFADRWVAVSRMDAQKGDKYYYDDALLMNNFHSKELERDFETIYFINKVSTIPPSMQDKLGAMPPSHKGKTANVPKSSVSLEKSEDELSVAAVFENANTLSEKEIEIRGIVVKVNKQVMGKNWIHIQDGTQFEESFDLTITSQNLPEKGDEVTFKGTIYVNKDFGSGYFYDVIMEEAKMTNQKKAASQL